MLRSAGCVLVFLAALFGVAAGVGHLAPLRLKAEWIRSHPGQYDTLFIGSSHIFRQIDPQRFDAHCAQGGLPTHSFNYGIPGTRLPEALHNVDTLMDLVEPGSLKRIFLELLPFDTSIRKENFLSERMVAWHDPRSTLRLFSSLAHEDLPLGEKLSRTSGHLEHALFHVARVGKGPVAVRALFGSGVDFEDRSSLGPHEDGFRALDLETDPNFVRRHEEFMNNPGKLRQARARVDHEPEQVPADPWLGALLHGVQEGLRARGVELILVIAPAIYPQPELLALQREGFVDHIVSFADSKRFPELYWQRNRYDLLHLNAEGARFLSDALAADYLALHEKR